MQSDRKQTGAIGEELAANYLRSLGWVILDRNWRCSAGELDIVAKKEPDTVVFCEVKTRRGQGYGHPLEAIGYKKVRKLRELSVHWLRARDVHPQHIRIDGIGILAQPGQGAKITHREGIA